MKWKLGAIGSILLIILAFIFLPSGDPTDIITTLPLIAYLGFWPYLLISLSILALLIIFKREELIAALRLLGVGGVLLLLGAILVADDLFLHSIDWQGPTIPFPDAEDCPPELEEAHICFTRLHHFMIGTLFVILGIVMLLFEPLMRKQ